MSTEKQGAIDFDVDGVFNTGSTEQYTKAIGKSLEAIDIAVDWGGLMEHVLGYWGPPPAKIMDLLIDRHAETAGIKDLARLTAMKKTAGLVYADYYRNDYIENIQPIKGTQEALGELALKYDLGLNTSADRDVIFDRMMPRLGIDPNIFRKDIVHTGSDLGAARHKPSPYALHELMRITGHDASRVLMVGDSATDVLSAVNAGVEPVVTLTGNLSRKDSEVMPVDYIIEDITHLGEILPRALGRGAIRLFRQRERIEWYQAQALRAAAV